ncbi:uncharacterized protein J3D65DRAFT_646245 [Phyllosticta citribraziliensis]|uniref:LYC1 C-terminal domain-containing protein n=1 Tax=Phyllosticta citribraziliensis TaxID=989973 RepID=A0ABR1LL56_9PEZI
MNGLANGHTNGHVDALPPSDAPSIALVEPTEEEKWAQWTLNGNSWKGALSLEGYCRREQHLANQDCTKNGGQSWWVLVDTACQGPRRRVLSGCETFCKPAVVAQNGKTTDVIVHGVGSVFCPPEHRGRGYAGRMLEELGKRLPTWQTSEKRKCLFSILYSDIGKKFYASHGWEPFPSSHISLPPVEESANSSKLPGLKELQAEDLAPLCAADEALLRKNLVDAANGKTRVALIPNVETIRWHHAREQFVGTELYGRFPSIKGGVVGDKEGQRIWCYWTRMWSNPNKGESKGNTLHILRIVIEPNVVPGSVVPAIAALLARAQREAAEWHMEQVDYWNPSPEVVAAAQLLDPKAEVVDRDSESIASLRWFGESPSDGGSIADSIEWVANEKYGWC